MYGDQDTYLYYTKVKESNILDIYTLKNGFKKIFIFYY